MPSDRDPPSKNTSHHAVAHVLEDYAEPWRADDFPEGSDEAWIIARWENAKSLSRREIFEVWKGRRPPISVVEHCDGGCFQAIELNASNSIFMEDTVVTVDLPPSDDWELEGATEEEWLSNPINDDYWDRGLDIDGIVVWKEPDTELVERCQQYMLKIGDEHAVE